MKALGICIVIAFILQAVVFLAVGALGVPDRFADIAGYALLPGIMLFWSEGIHSDFPFWGFVIAVVVDTAYFGILVFGVFRAFRGLQSAKGTESQRPSSR